MSRNRSWLLPPALLAAACGLAPTDSESQTAALPVGPEVVLQTPPATTVSSVTVSPDGTLVATAGGEGGVRLYNARSGAMVRALGDVGDRSVVFTPDGKYIAAAGFHMDKLVGVYEVRTGKRVKSLAGHTEWEADATAISPDGKLLASSGTDRQILVWELETGKLRHRFQNQPHRMPALAFSPDSATLASGGGERSIRLWDMTSGDQRGTIGSHDDWIAALAFSPDGRTIASGSCDWTYHRGRNVAEFAGTDPGCVSEWKLWDAGSRELKRSARESGRLLSLTFAPNGKSLACAIGRNVKHYDLRSDAPGQVISTYDFDATSVAFTPDGAALISGSHDQTVRRTALAAKKQEWEAPGSWEQVNSISLSPDGKLLVAGSSDRRFAVRTLRAGSKGLKPGVARLWDARTGKLLRRLDEAKEDAGGHVMAVRFSPDGRRIAVGGSSVAGAGTVRVCDAATGAYVWSIVDHGAEVQALAFSPDGSVLASAGAEGAVRVREPQTGKVIQTLEGHEGGATSLAFSAEGRTLVCGEGKGGTRVWDVQSGRLLNTCKSPASSASTVTTDRLFTTVALGADGLFAACPATVGNTYGEPTRFWDIRTGKLRKEIGDSNGRPIALSPDGAILATGGKTVRLWDVKTGKRLRELFGHMKKTQALEFSADGRHLFSGSSWGSVVNAWEVATGKHLVTLFAWPRGKEGKDDWLAYHPEGFFNGSPGAERLVAWRVGSDLKSPAQMGRKLHRPERIAAALAPR
jgi:WD40 repeat protein